jgi:serine/threonine protein kinase
VATASRSVLRGNHARFQVKIIDKAAIKDVEDVNRYTREFAILNSIQHKNIIRLHELQQNDQFFYVVMDLCVGDLNDIIKKEGADPPKLEIITSNGECKAARKVLSEDVAREYFRQIISGVEYSHRQNIIHRDIKQENVLVDMAGNLRL